MSKTSQRKVSRRSLYKELEAQGFKDCVAHRPFKKWHRDKSCYEQYRKGYIRAIYGKHSELF